MFSKHQNYLPVNKLKSIPIIDVAIQLGVTVKKKKSLCYNGHDRNTESLSFAKKYSFKCFGCGDSGDQIQLVRNILKLDFKEACSWLCKNFNVEEEYSIKRTKKPLKRINTVKTETQFLANVEVYEWLINQLTLSTKGLRYLTETRKFSASTIESLQIKDITTPSIVFQNLIAKWGIETLAKCGLAKYDDNNLPKFVWWDHVLIFPFFNLTNRIDYLQARRISSGDPKYVNLINVHPSIYNLNTQANLPTINTVCICEGVPDTISAIEFKRKAVGILGANNFKEEWVKYFMDSDVIIIPDNDNGGRIFSENVRTAFKKVGKVVSINKLPENVKDLNEFLIRSSNRIQ